ncbi:MAG TPA: nuclear transport factor 2 family protein [Pyrinomonadaceae bacterium]|nr:nuclear transport factor 2 family protein [Pyrinomonadaceae bacterium]
MKRSLTALSVVLSLVILGASSCTVAPNGNNSAATNGNTNANAAAANSNANLSTASGGAVADAITAKEKQIWDALKNKDHDAFGKMLASDMIYVSSDGVYDKAATLNGLKEFAPTEITLSDWKTLMLDEDAAVVTYTVDAKGTSGGQPIPSGALRASSAWVKRGAEWLAVYHQDCPTKEPAAAAATPAAETSKPSSSAANANANTSTSAAKHAEMVASDDPVAIEKHLWEALKQKDWDTFAAHLAAEQVEVEPGGVSDRAATLASVKEVDFSKTTVSDFKATKLDDDATLVTYMVRGTGPDGKPSEHRASTIWVERDGKWLAFFHHGTPVMKMPAK